MVIRQWKTIAGYEKYRVIHKSLRVFRSLRYSSRDGHAEGEHVNRGRDTPSFCPTLQVLDMSNLLRLSWLLRSRFRKFRRDLWIILYYDVGDNNVHVGDNNICPSLFYQSAFFFFGSLPKSKYFTKFS